MVTANEITDLEIDNAIKEISAVVGSTDPAVLLRRCIVTIHKQSLEIDRLHDELSSEWGKFEEALDKALEDDWNNSD